MKASEAKPLSAEELQTLKLLMQRWVLLKYPYYGGSSEAADAFTTFYSICETTVESQQRTKEDEEEINERMADHGETDLELP